MGRNNHHAALLALAGSALLCTACAGPATIEPDGTLVRHYIGYVKVIVPQAAGQGAVYSSDVSAWGLRVGNGVGLGYLRDRHVVVPLDCRLVLLVANQAQLDDAIARLDMLGKHHGPCAVVDTSIPTGGQP